MKESVTVFVEGEIVEEDVEFTLVELCRASGASEEQLTLWRRQGWHIFTRHSRMIRWR